MQLSLSSYEMFMRLRHTLPSHLKKNIKTKNHFDKLNLSHFNEMRKTRMGHLASEDVVHPYPKFIIFGNDNLNDYC